jgi:putative DNA primase/helicase
MIAENLAKALGGHRAGSGWMARCPAHEDRKPSLSIRDADNKLLIHCHAGCAQERVISALRARGLWSDHRPRSISRMARGAPVARDSYHENKRRSEAALAIWQCAQSATGSRVESYLASRGIDLLPDVLRFHAGLKHPSDGIWPAMVALVTDGVGGKPLAIHRTYLARDGAGKAPIEPQKVMLGPCRGGVVRLAQPGSLLMIGEGIETCLSAMQATGLPAWAALSTSGLRSLNLPTTVRDVILLADGDDPGEAAAQECARRWKREGRRVRIARPPKGMDFNDMLMAFRPVIGFADGGNTKVTASATDGSSPRGDLPWR